MTYNSYFLICGIIWTIFWQLMLLVTIGLIANGQYEVAGASFVLTVIALLNKIKLDRIIRTIEN